MAAFHLTTLFDMVRQLLCPTFLLSRTNDVDAVLLNIRSLGGKILRTDVDLELAKPGSSGTGNGQTAPAESVAVGGHARRIPT